MAFVDEMHQLKVAAYLSKKDILQIFWRSSPRQPYPWSKAKSNIESAPA
jgi:hypothetical protein